MNDEPRRAAARRDTTPATPATRRELLHGAVAGRVIRALHAVHDELVPDLLESVYEAALCKVLEDMGIGHERQCALDVPFRGTIIGTFRADVVVERQVLVELKVARTLLPIHEAQVLNYLKLSGLRVGILANFANRLEVRRFVL